MKVLHQWNEDCVSSCVGAMPAAEAVPAVGAAPAAAHAAASALPIAHLSLAAALAELSAWSCSEPAQKLSPVLTLHITPGCSWVQESSCYDAQPHAEFSFPILLYLLMAVECEISVNTLDVWAAIDTIKEQT